MNEKERKQTEALEARFILGSKSLPDSMQELIKNREFVMGRISVLNSDLRRYNTVLKEIDDKIVKNQDGKQKT
jgi:hypothetical protein